MTTTIKVDDEVRDRLKRQAAVSGRTLGQQVEYLVGLGERSLRYRELQAAMDATSPEEWESYRAEAEAWERVDR